MDFWIKFWTLLLFASMAVFVCLAVVVTIGGFFNIKSLFETLTKNANEKEENE